MSLLDDTEAGPSWIANCRQVKTLSWFGDREREVHTFFSSPWPVTDRDMVTFSFTQKLDNGGIKIEVVDHGDQHPTLSHYVRMENIRGEWLAVPLEDGKTSVTYTGYGEPAGSIPRWLANSIVKDASMETFTKMRKIIRQPKYYKHLED